MAPPVTGGIAVKNKILADTLRNKKISVEIIDTRYWIKNFLNIIKLLFISDPRIILSISKNGRYVLLPVLYFFKLIKYDLRYSIMPGGGSIHNEINNMRPIFKYIFIKNLKKADYIFAQTKELTSNLIMAGFENVEYIPNFKVIKELFSHQYNNENDQFKIIFISRVNKQKGIEISLDAINKLIKENDMNIIYHIYGPIAKDYEKFFLEKLYKYPFARYKGIVDHEIVSKIISSYDIFLFPTFHISEGFPGVILDAFIAGVPVIVTDWNFNSEIVSNEKNGFLVKPKNIDDLSEKMLMLVQDKILRKEMGNNNIKESKKYDANIVVDDIIHYLKSKQWN